MRAAVMRGDRFEVEERPIPTPGPGEVLTKVRACGICGSDLHYFHHLDGLMGLARKVGWPTDSIEANLKAGPVLGHEFVCEVAGFGPDTRREIETGQKVCSMPFLLRPAGPILIGSSPEATGAYAEYMLLSEATCLAVDEAIPDEAAALTEPLGIAVHAVNKARMKPEDVAVVVGCGPIGLATIAVLKARGWAHIIASDLSPKRRQLARVMGATTVVDAAETSVVAAAGEAAPGAPLVVFESTGARGMLHRLITEAPQNTRIIGVGIPAGEETILPMVAIVKEIELTFVIYYTAEEFAEALALVGAGAIDWRPLVTGKVGLDGVTEAFAALADPEAHAKILIEPWRDGGL
jgi:threonine dehydrogenase-like Zn-dependent dehydrogenase